MKVHARPAQSSIRLRRSVAVDLISGRTTRHDVTFEGATIVGHAAGVRPDELTLCALFPGELDLPEPLTVDFLSEHKDEAISWDEVALDGSFHLYEVEADAYTLLIVAGSREALAESSKSNENVRAASGILHIEDDAGVFVELMLP